MYDILIVGAGAAGMTAAIYGVRGGKSVIIAGGLLCTGSEYAGGLSVREMSGLAVKYAAQKPPLGPHLCTF